MAYPLRFSPTPYPSFVTVRALCPPRLVVSYLVVRFALSAPLPPLTLGSRRRPTGPPTERFRMHTPTHISVGTIPEMGSGFRRAIYPSRS